MIKQLTIDNGQLTIKLQMSNDKGQVLVLLIVIITVALATGLSIIQKSVSDIATASKIEQSSRAFSAAEAGIERALQGDSDPNVSFPSNNSQAVVSDQGLQPPVAESGTQQEPLEYPPLAKEDVVQVWLADPAAPLPDCAGFTCYKQSGLDIYWGNSATDKAALVLTLVYYEGGQYKENKKWYLDNSQSAYVGNGFEKVNCLGNYTVGLNRYQCKKTITSLPLPPAVLMLMRARLVYNSSNQPFALRATGTCGSDCSLPPQARKIYSTGNSGETQRRIMVFQEKNVVPYFFDYAVFSAGDINK